MRVYVHSFWRIRRNAIERAIIASDTQFIEPLDNA